MKTKPLYQELASRLEAYANCRKSDNPFADVHAAIIRDMAKELLPSGSGIDRGCNIDFEGDGSNGPGWREHIVVLFGFHHMNEAGFYDGWTEHTLTVRPSLARGLDLRISGPNRNDIKDSLYETFDYTLRRPVEWDKETERYRFAAEAERRDVPPISTVNASEAFERKQS